MRISDWSSDVCSSDLVLDVDRGVALLEADVGQLASVRTPRRRQKRLGRTHHGLRVVAIRIGHRQRIADALARDGDGHVDDAWPASTAQPESSTGVRACQYVCTHGDVARISEIRTTETHT